MSTQQRVINQAQCLRSAWRMKHRKLRADEDKYDPQMEKKCLKTLKYTVWSEHPQATSVFLLEKN